MFQNSSKSISNFATSVWHFLTFVKKLPTYFSFLYLQDSFVIFNILVEHVKNNFWILSYAWFFFVFSTCHTETFNCKLIVKMIIWKQETPTKFLNLFLQSNNDILLSSKNLLQIVFELITHSTFCNTSQKHLLTCNFYEGCQNPHKCHNVFKNTFLLFWWHFRIFCMSAPSVCKFTSTFCCGVTRVEMFISYCFNNCFKRKFYLCL